MAPLPPAHVPLPRAAVRLAVRPLRAAGSSACRECTSPPPPSGGPPTTAALVPDAPLPTVPGMVGTTPLASVGASVTAFVGVMLSLHNAVVVVRLAILAILAYPLLLIQLPGVSSSVSGLPRLPPACCSPRLRDRGGDPALVRARLR